MKATENLKENEMDARVHIISINKHNEIEWDEEFFAISLSAAKAKATKWMKHEIFESDYRQITKEDIGQLISFWTLRK